MRIVFIGAGDVAVHTARELVKKEHEVVIVEMDKSKIDALAGKLDCSFLCGNGGDPDILREAAPEDTDVLIVTTDSDQTNILVTLVARSLDFKRVVTRMHDPKYEVICQALGLEEPIIPTRTISRYLCDMVEGMDIFEMSTAIKDEARLFTFKAGKEEAGAVSDLKLPDQARVICYYRNDEFKIADPDTKLREDDEVVVLAHSESLEELEDRWPPNNGKAKNQQTDTNRRARKKSNRKRKTGNTKKRK